MAIQQQDPRHKLTKWHSHKIPSRLHKQKKAVGGRWAVSQKLKSILFVFFNRSGGDTHHGASCDEISADHHFLFNDVATVNAMLCSCSGKFHKQQSRHEQGELWPSLVFLNWTNSHLKYCLSLCTVYLWIRISVWLILKSIFKSAIIKSQNSFNFLL